MADQRPSTSAKEYSQQSPSYKRKKTVNDTRNHHHPPNTEQETTPSPSIRHRYVRNMEEQASIPPTIPESNSSSENSMNNTESHINETTKSPSSPFQKSPAPRHQRTQNQEQSPITIHPPTEDPHPEKSERSTTNSENTGVPRLNARTPNTQPSPSNNRNIQAPTEPTSPKPSRHLKTPNSSRQPNGQPNDAQQSQSNTAHEAMTSISNKTDAEIHLHFQEVIAKIRIETQRRIEKEKALYENALEDNRRLTIKLKELESKLLTQNAESVKSQYTSPLTQLQLQVKEVTKEKTKYLELYQDAIKKAEKEVVNGQRLTREITELRQKHHFALSQAIEEASNQRKRSEELEDKLAETQKKVESEYRQRVFLEKEVTTLKGKIKQYLQHQVQLELHSMQIEDGNEGEHLPPITDKKNQRTRKNGRSEDPATASTTNRRRNNHSLNQPEARQEDNSEEESTTEDHDHGTCTQHNHAHHRCEFHPREEDIWPAFHRPPPPPSIPASTPAFLHHHQQRGDEQHYTGDSSRQPNSGHQRIKGSIPNNEVSSNRPDQKRNYNINNHSAAPSTTSQQNPRITNDGHRADHRPPTQQAAAKTPTQNPNSGDKRAMTRIPQSKPIDRHGAPGETTTRNR